MLLFSVLVTLFSSSNSQTTADQICILGTPGDETNLLFDGAYRTQNLTINNNNYYRKSIVGQDMYLYMSTTSEDCPTYVSTNYGYSYCWCLIQTSDLSTNYDNCDIYMAVENDTILPSSTMNPWHGEYYWDDYTGFNVTEQNYNDFCQDMEVTDECFEVTGAPQKRYDWFWLTTYKFNGFYRQKGFWGTSYEYTQKGQDIYLFIGTTAGGCDTYLNGANVTSDYCWCIDNYYQAYESWSCDIQAPIENTAVNPVDITTWYRYNGSVWDGLTVTSVDVQKCDANQIIVSLFTVIISIVSISFLS